MRVMCRRLVVEWVFLLCNVLTSITVLAWTGVPSSKPVITTTFLSKQQQHSSSVLLLDDLKRVVQRKDRLTIVEQAEQDIRRRKFVMIPDDSDGCERGILMLERWRNSTTPCFVEAYEVCACALVENRWRAQWRRPCTSNNTPTTTTTTNTAEQLLLLYRWMKLDHIVPSVTFLEAVLAGLASCSSTFENSHRKQEQLYGNIAHEIWKQELQYHQDQQEHQQNQSSDETSSTSSTTHLPTSLAFHVVRGYCWQQENKGDAEYAQAADDIYRNFLLNDPTYDAPARRLLAEAWSKATYGAQRCQEIFDSFGGPEKTAVVVPEDVVINTALAWSKQPQGAAKAEHVLLSSLQPEHRLNQLALQAVVAAWAREGRPDRAERLLPYCNTVRCINSVLHAWLLWPDNKDAALKRIEEIIGTMARPNAFTYATLIKAYRQAPTLINAPAAVSAWRQLVGLRAAGDRSIMTCPVVITNIALNVCARSADGVLALQLLNDHVNATNTQPDIISYTSVLQAIANDVTNFTEDVIVNIFKSCSQPNARTYAMCILALANHNGSPTTAYEILQQGHPHHNNTFPYNYVLKCCVNNQALSDPTTSFRIAAKTFQLITTPDSYSYSMWLRCVQIYTPLENDPGNLRERCLRHVAAGAKKHECWENETVQLRFAECCPKHLRKELLVE